MKRFLRHVLDSTGFSVQGIRTVLKNKKDLNARSWDERTVFAAGDTTLKTMMGVLLKVPEPLKVSRSCEAKHVISTLGRLFRKYGIPAFTRSDNGPEFVAKDVINSLSDLPTTAAFIEPGSPWRNGYCESLNSQISSKLTDGTVFRSVLEAKVLADDYRDFYNTKRLHGALDYTTLEEVYQAWVHNQAEKSLSQTGS